MATNQLNNIAVEYDPPKDYAIKTDGTADINGGDLVYLDTAAHVVKSLDSDAHAADLVGMAKNGSYIQPYSAKAYNNKIPVAGSAKVRLFTTAGDTYHEGDKVYYGTDAQTITNTAGGMTHVIGTVSLRDGQATLAGAAGLQVEVNLQVLQPAGF